MKVTLTFKLAALTKNDLIHTFAKEASDYRAVIESAHARGMFGDPALTELRWLLVGGRWDDSIHPYIPQGSLEGDEVNESRADPTGTSSGSDGGSEPANA